jgi:outer membrane immunogenic protein
MGKLVLRALALVAAAWTMSAQAADMNYGSRAP